MVERTPETPAIDRGCRRRKESAAAVGTVTLPIGSVPNAARWRRPGLAAAMDRRNGTAALVPLQEEEVIQAIRLLTKFGEVG